MKLKDAVYKSVEIIFVAVLVFVLLGFAYIKFNHLMSYSGQDSSENNKEQSAQSDIGISEEDLVKKDYLEQELIQDDDALAKDETEHEETSSDEATAFVSPVKVTLTVAYGEGCYDILSRLAALYYDNGSEKYTALYTELVQFSNSHGAELSMQPGTFVIPEGSSVREIFKIISSLQNL